MGRERILNTCNNQVDLKAFPIQPGQSLSEALAVFVCKLEIGALPIEVLAKAKVCLLHQLAIGLAGWEQPHAKLVAGMSDPFADSGKASVILGGSRVPALDAAFANGVLFHARVQDDTYHTTHIGTTILPVLLGIAETQSKTGAEVIVAMVAGYEVAAALSNAYTAMSTPRSFRASTLYGTIGAAAASARLLGLNEERTASAIGCAATFAFGTVEPFSAGSDEFRFHNGLAARNGLLAAQLAKAGVVAARTAFEGPGGFLNAFVGSNQDPTACTANLGREFEMLKVNFKPFPICAGNQTPYLNGVLLREMAGDIDASDIDRVLIEMNPYEALHPGIAYYGPFENSVQALMSTPYAVAHALLGRTITLGSLYAPADSEIDVLVQKCHVSSASDLKMLSSRICVNLNDGHHIANTFIPARNLFHYSWQQEVDLVRKLLPEMPIDSERLEKIIETISDLPQLTDLSALMALVRIESY